MIRSDSTSILVQKTLSMRLWDGGGRDGFFSQMHEKNCSRINLYFL